MISSSNVIVPKPAYLGTGIGLGDEPSKLTETLRILLSRTQGRFQLPPRERRATPRVQIELCCEERSGRRPQYVTTWDLSTFGLSTRTGEPQQLGQVLPIRLHLPDDLKHPLDLVAKVVGFHQTTGGMRLAFQQPPREALQRIHRYLFGRGAKPQGEA